MACVTLVHENRPSNSNSNKLLKELIMLNQNFLNKGLILNDMKNIACVRRRYLTIYEKFSRKGFRLSLVCSATVITTLLISVIFKLPVIDGMMKSALGIKCVLPNNYLVWEATRPVADCSICKGVNSVLILPNVSREDFQRFAYSYRPILIKGAARHWPAMKQFNFNFFKDLFENIDGAYDSIEEECQFLNFKTDFHSLKDVFSMSSSRSKLLPGENPWYIGWSNCHPEVLKQMRKYYDKPHFLPSDAEHSHVDYIFMGFQQGAFMHLDYISRLMWQAQLRGHKVWQLNPPPECEHVCSGYSFTVSPGDILLLDTRQWYHDTHVINGEFSLTVSSEYG